MRFASLVLAMGFLIFPFVKGRAFAQETLQISALTEQLASEDSHFFIRDGERFSLQAWLPPSKEIKAAVIAIHGIGAAASEFEPLGKLLMQEKIAVYAPNLRRQGLDPITKRRGSDLNVEQLLLDIRTIVADVQQKNPHVPLLFYGESMGALLVAHFLNNSNPESSTIKGAILAVPVVQLANPPSPMIRKIIHLVATYFPSFRMSTKWFRKSTSLPLSHDPEMHYFLEHVPHRIEKFSVSFLDNMGFLIDSASQMAAGIHQPILILAAGNDDYVSVHAISQWFEKISSFDKILAIFPKSYHRLLFDLDRKDVEKTISHWLKQRFLQD